MDTKVDRRSGKRIVTELSVRVRTAPGSPEATAQTRDLSTNGVFLYTQSRLEAGSEVELILILPPEITLGEKRWVCCHARVLRVEPGAGRAFGVAAEIRRMEVLPELAG